MAKKEIITREDRKGWELYRREWQATGRRKTYRSVNRHQETGGAEIGGEDANRIAAFLEGRMSKAERPRFERDMVERASFLDTVNAASRSRSAGPIHAAEMPESMKVWARNAYASAIAARQTPAKTVKERKNRPWFMRPAFATASAAAVVMAVGVGGVTLTRQTQQSSDRLVETRSTDADAASVSWSEDGNSFFQNPAESYFDGLDID